MSKPTRLRLDWSITTRSDRNQFIKDYLNTISFQPNEDELDMMAKYILWGTNKDGLNGRQEGLELETASGLWDSQSLESLDALTETPGFNEATLRSLNEVPKRKPKLNFSREAARRTASPDALAALEDLWQRIDETDLLLNLYEKRLSKRTTIRQDLLDRTTSQYDFLHARASKLTPFQYLKLKHQLVELRRQQYTIKDSYTTPIESHSEPLLSIPGDMTLGDEISVLPLGIISAAPLTQKVFNPERFPNPSDFTPNDLEAVTNLLYKPRPKMMFQFDFRNTDHLYRLVPLIHDLYDSIDPDETLDLSRAAFLQTWELYRHYADLSPIHSDILDLKMRHCSNQVIADIINSKYSKSYKPNYISTLYCQKALGGIAHAAVLHLEIVQSLCFPENFKVCKDCGRTLLLNEENFMKRARSNDGFSPRCKKCEKLKRNRS